MTARISLILRKPAVIDRAYRCFFVSFVTPSTQEGNASLTFIHSFIDRAYSSSIEILSFVYIQIFPAICIASIAISRAPRSEYLLRARAAARAYGPPEPIA